MGGRRLTDFQKRQIIAKWKAGEATRSIANDVGVSQATVWNYAHDTDRLRLPSSSDSEQWKQLDGYGGRYYVSSLGRVASISGTGLLKYLQIQEGRYTHSKVVLSDKHPIKVQLCRLVAEAFCVGRDDSHAEVLHINGDIHDNRAANLMWDATGDGIDSGNWRRRAMRTRLTSHERGIASEMWLAGETKHRIATALALDWRAVSRYLNTVPRATSVDVGTVVCE